MPVSYVNRCLVKVGLISLILVSACSFFPGDTPEPHIEKARIFIAENNLNAGILELKNALQIESNLPEARWMLGKIYLQTGNGAAAFKEISQAQSLGFRDPQLDSLLLQVMLLQRRYEDILDKTYTDEVMSTETLVLRGKA